METLKVWKESMAEGTLSLSAKLQQSLEDSFVTSLQDILGGKLTVEFKPQMKEGFTISPADGTFKLSFKDEDFANLFKSYLRPRTNQILYKD